MKTMRRALVVCLLLAGAAGADIAPTTYDGYTLSPRANCDIRMAGEEVNIYCGQRCRVTARFDMHNDANAPIDLFVGFPVQHLYSKQNGVYDFQVRVDDVAIENIRNANDYSKKSPSWSPLPWTWYDLVTSEAADSRREPKELTARLGAGR